MKDIIIEILCWIIGFFTIFLLFYGIGSKIKYCNDNPNSDECKVQEQEQTNNNDGGIKCGWVFGSGFRCGVGF